MYHPYQDAEFKMGFILMIKKDSHIILKGEYHYKLLKWGISTKNVSDEVEQQMELRMLKQVESKMMDY